MFRKKIYIDNAFRIEIGITVLPILLQAAQVSEGKDGVEA
jgi:hypothetical protein